jgi:hypothetical protein
MPLDTVTIGPNLSVAANAVSADQLLNQIPQFLQGPVVVRMRAIASAAGLNMTLILDGRIRVFDQGIANIGVAGSPVILPDHLVGEFPFGGGRTILTFRNTTGGAITVTAFLEFFH